MIVQMHVLFFIVLFIGIVRKKYYLEKTGQLFLKKNTDKSFVVYSETEVTSKDTHLDSCNNNTGSSFKHRFESTGMLLERSELKITGDLGQGMHNYTMFYNYYRCTILNVGVECFT